MICALEKGLRVQKFANLHSPPKPTETPAPTTNYSRPRNRFQAVKPQRKMTSAKDAILALGTAPPCQPVSPLQEKAVDPASVWLCVNDIASSYLGRRSKLQIVASCTPPIATEDVSLLTASTAFHRGPTLRMCETARLPPKASTDFSSWLWPPANGRHVASGEKDLPHWRTYRLPTPLG